MTKETLTRKHIILSVVAVALLALAVWLWQYSQSMRQLKRNDQFAIKPFSLINMDGHRFTNKNLEGRWSLIFFGFTNCPSICPTTLSRLDKAYRMLVEQKTNPMPQIIFISVDPERDGPYTIRQYLANFNKKFIGAMGSKEEINKLTEQFRVVYAKSESDDMDYYISHSGKIMVINPKGSLVATLKPPFDAESIAKDFHNIQKNYQKEERDDHKKR